VILTAAILIAAPFAVAATGDPLREGVRNGTTAKETEIIGNITAKTGKGGYVTRQSNIATGANAGGAAIYGCRAPAGGTTTGSAPCLRASNLGAGNAFEFAASGGPIAGVISVGNPAAANPSAAPFTTNATAVATGLNADKVDGKDASELTGATGPQGPAGISSLRVAQSSSTSIAACDANTVSGCPDILTRTVGAGNWLVQAKLTVDNNGVAAASTGNRCGLAQGTTVLDEARNSLGANSATSQNESVSLMAVVKDAADGATIAVRCTEQAGETLQVEDVKLTTLKIDSVVGP
jgi:hypothetical protein